MLRKEDDPKVRAECINRRIDAMRSFVPSAAVPAPSCLKNSDELVSNLDDAFAVLAGVKPAAWIPKGGDNVKDSDIVPYITYLNYPASITWDDMKDAAKKAGVKCMEIPPEDWQIEEYRQGITSGANPELFFYKEDAQLTALTKAQDFHRLGRMEQYHWAMGKVLGYPDDAIKKFVSQSIAKTSP